MRYGLWILILHWSLIGRKWKHWLLIGGNVFCKTKPCHTWSLKLIKIYNKVVWSLWRKRRGFIPSAHTNLVNLLNTMCTKVCSIIKQKTPIQLSPFDSKWNSSQYGIPWLIPLVFPPAWPLDYLHHLRVLKQIVWPNSKKLSEDKNQNPLPLTSDKIFSLASYRSPWRNPFCAPVRRHITHRSHIYAGEWILNIDGLSS